MRPGLLPVPYDDGSSPWEHADTETIVWLPARAPLDDHADFTAGEWYQVAMTHRAMHQRLGTFEPCLDGLWSPATRKESCRPV